MFGLETLSPKFMVPSNRISVLYEPKDFYKHLCDRILQAKKRVFLASLYLGKSESELVDVISEALTKNSSLKVYVLVDALRGTREAPNTCSASLLSPLQARYPQQVQLALYKTPKLGWLTSKLLPKRVIEGVGLQHMKLYGFDDEIMLSGANLSRDYFTNRQDRYISICDTKITEWFFQIHSQVSHLSYRLLSADNEQKFVMERPTMSAVKRAKITLKQLISPGYSSSIKQETETNLKNSSITEVYPVCQFTPLGFGNEHQALMSIARETMSSNMYSWLFTAGYFNVEAKLGAELANGTNGEIVIASPKANGFYGSKGISGKIPHYYSILAAKFFKAVPSSGALKVRIWQRGIVTAPNGWSYHAKGLWLWTKSSSKPVPFLTYIGSSNFTCRSYKHDIECGAILITDSTKAQVEPQISEVLHTHADDIIPGQPGKDEYGYNDGSSIGTRNNQNERTDLSLQLAAEVKNIIQYCSDPINPGAIKSPPAPLHDQALLRLLGNRL